MPLGLSSDGGSLAAVAPPTSSTVRGLYLPQYPAMSPSSLLTVGGLHLPSPVSGRAAGTGMVLSPATQPIPANLVQRIQSGQFIEMRDLLSDNIALIDQLSYLSGLVPLPQIMIQ